MASLSSTHLLPALRSPPAASFHRKPCHISFDTLCRSSSRLRRHLAVSAVFAESDPPKSTGGDAAAAAALGPHFEDLSAALILPPDYLERLPSDLRLDLNDAAFDLSNGAVIDEGRHYEVEFRPPSTRKYVPTNGWQSSFLTYRCGLEVGEILLNLSRAWEQADTATSNSIASQLSSLQKTLADNVKLAFGKRLVSAGRRFEGMGQYGQGELERIAKAMIKTGKVLSASPVVKTEGMPKEESRVLKFGELQIELTSEKAYIGAMVGFVFGIISWQLSQGIQSTPEISLQYANDNALQLAKSLRGALLAICYSSTILSASASVGLVLLGRQLSSGSESEDV